MPVNTTIDTVGDLITALRRFDASSPIAFYAMSTNYGISQIAKVTVEGQERTVITLDTPVIV